MFITNAMYILIELFFLRRQSNWTRRWKKALAEEKIGAPLPYWAYPRSSGNLIHHTYHIAQLESRLKERINAFDCIVEYGGGYGSMCRLCRNLGYEGDYFIFDF